MITKNKKSRAAYPNGTFGLVTVDEAVAPFKELLKIYLERINEMPASVKGGFTDITKSARKLIQKGN